MSFRSDIAAEILQCLGKMKSENRLHDFTVKIDDVEIGCHRVVLAACSEFFYCLLMSGMKEANTSCVTLNGISVRTFEQILHSLYTAEDILTKENFIDVWQAVNQLQVSCLIKRCESFAKELLSLDNFDEIFKIAKYLGSKNVTEFCEDFMLINFETISKRNQFFEMPAEKVIELVKSPKLVIKNEDLVLEAVINWVQYTSTDEDTEGLLFESIELANETDSVVSIQATQSEPIGNDEGSIKVQDRKTYFQEMLKAVKTCLLTPSCLVRALNHDLVKSNTDAKEIIIKGILYNLKIFTNGQWPNAATYRTSSEYVNVGVCVEPGGSLQAVSMNDGKWCSLCSLPGLKLEIQILALGQKLYAVGARDAQQTKATLCVLTERNWDRIMDLPTRSLYLIAHENILFILNKEDKMIYKINETYKDLELLYPFPDIISVEFAMCFDKYMLVFYTEFTKGVDTMTVYCLDMHGMVWSRLTNMDGSAESMVSFNDDDNTYILQANGTLWKVNLPSFGDIEFLYLANLWEFPRQLFGALTYNGTLFISGACPEYESEDLTRIIKSIPGLFSSVQYLIMNQNCSNFVPVILPKSCLKCA
ncbi:kelch-like protein 24 [Physella acuta]|uniref:kelch-like protein 24 n=1 Tax=Physella acuta TaxID=109671 RepID=UPI0027DB9DA1|nr:kelch-like protein 24 [Physella acuta]